MGCRSEAVTTYEAGPIPEPCMMLAVDYVVSRLFTGVLGSMGVISEERLDPVKYVVSQEC
jgi:hypothetical protein